MFLKKQQEVQEVIGHGRGNMKNPHLNGKKTIKKKTTIRKDVMPASPKKKSAGEKYYSNLKNYKGTGYNVNKGSKTYRQKLADKKRADVRDAARGGFKSVASMEKKGALTRMGQRVKKQTKAELTKLKGRR